MNAPINFEQQFAAAPARVPLVVSVGEVINLIGFMDSEASDLREILDFICGLAMARNDVVLLALATSARDHTLEMTIRALDVDLRNNIGYFAEEREDL
ncbi:hypothetical protein [Pandoraea terrigena]|uniref:Uncharacterized protein n=1 Tax=Pandoraea terrigena TaxID=2508292 RepID=A0A5E4UNH8_9BURK|nr:hypothetical protein [Pandoraea terrigena]VVE01581.1 hypothetical protein PTE31013_02171 [Pandoraea terrigena]